MGLDRARDQSDSAHQQHQHHDGVEKAGWLKIDVHVANHARQDEKQTAAGKQPPDNASALPEKNADAEQQRYERNTERACAPQVPVGTDHAHLIEQEVASGASHDEAEDEFGESTRRPAHVAHRTVFHGPSISDICPEFAEQKPCRTKDFEKISGGKVKSASLASHADS